MRRSDEFGRPGAIPGAYRTRERVTSRLLLVVASTAPARLAYFKHLYGSETVEVILDRRVSQRRRRHALVIRERRQTSRRRRDISEEIRNFGWALVRR
jgi:hypothetical protein